MELLILFINRSTFKIVKVCRDIFFLSSLRLDYDLTNLVSDIDIFFHGNVI